MSTEMLMKNRERFIKNVNSNENGAAALSLRLFCYARFMAVKNPYAETHDWVYENELTSAQANQYVFRFERGIENAKVEKRRVYGCIWCMENA